MPVQGCKYWEHVEVLIKPGRGLNTLLSAIGLKFH
jgi:hypothetical protein